MVIVFVWLQVHVHTFNMWLWHTCCHWLVVIGQLLFWGRGLANSRLLYLHEALRGLQTVRLGKHSQKFGFKVQRELIFRCGLMSEKQCGGGRLSHCLLFLSSVVNIQSCRVLRSHINVCYCAVLYECVWYWCVLLCCWCYRCVVWIGMNDSWAAVVGVLIINAWSISLPLFHYLSIFSFALWLILSLSLPPSGLSASLALYLNAVNRSNNGQKNRTCLFLLLLLSPSLHTLSLLHYHFLSHSLFLSVRLFLLAPGLSVSHRFQVKRARKRRRQQRSPRCCWVSRLAVQSDRHVWAALGSVMWLL